MTPVEAMQATLAAEHAALYLYGVLGARTSQSAQPALYASVEDGYRRHRARRDQLQLFVRDAGEVPVAAEPAYDVPRGWTTPSRISAAGLEIERSSTDVLAAMVAQTASEPRTWAAGELTWSALQSLAFGGLPETWPGAPELGAASASN